MKLLFLNSSPWANGSISVMMDAMAEEAVARGHETVYLRVSDLSVHPCVGCMTCRSSKTCCLGEDDAHRVGELLSWADMIVVGAPCYWGNIPGTLKTLLDRLVYAMTDTEGQGLFPRPLLKGRKAIVVTASTTPWPLNRLFGQTSGVVSALRKIFRLSGVKITGTYHKGDTRRARLPDERDIRRCLKLLPR